MNLTEAAKKIDQALIFPVETWPGYSPKSIPLAIYDAQDVIFYNHPDPPQERPEQLTAATAVEINNDRLAVDTKAVQISLTGVQRVGENMFKLGPVG